MYDGMGCIVTLPRKYNEYLERQGIKCRIFSPIVPLLSTHQNNRDHRKIMVIDGATAFCGGINISDEYINERCVSGIGKIRDLCSEVRLWRDLRRCFLKCGT